MNILILGGGGREHALAWAFAQNPKFDRLWCAPGNAGIAEEATCVALDILDGDKIAGFCPRERHRLRDDRPRGAARRRRRRRPARRRHPDPRPRPRGRPPRGLQGLRQGDLRRLRRPHRRQPDLHRPRRRPRLRRRPRAPRSSSRPTASPPARASPSPRPSPRRHAALDAIFAEGPGARVVVEEFMAGEEASLFVLADGDDLLLARHRPGPQARLRRRPRPEHRRHGRLLPGPGDDPRGHRGRARPHRPPDPRRDGPPRHPVPGRALRRPDDRGRRAAPRRVQRPLRRPRGAGARHAPRRPAPRRLPRLRHRRARRRARQLRRRPRDDRGDGGQGLPGRLRPRRADRPARERRPAGQGLPRRHPPRRRPPRLERRPGPQRHRPRRHPRRGPRPRLRRPRRASTGPGGFARRDIGWRALAPAESRQRSATLS